MDNKFYVSYEAARLLKEKGYNEECDTTIDDDGELFDEKYLLNQDLPVWRCSCPTKAEAIDWLERNGIMVETLYKRFELKWFYGILVLSTRESYSSDDYNTRLAAEDAAIIKALELLQ